MELKEMALQYRESRERRLALERQAKELKAAEDSLKMSLIQELSSMGARTVSLPDVGRITMKDGRRYEIGDIEAFCFFAFSQFVKAAEEQRPLMDGLVFQRRIAATAIEDYMNRTDSDAADLEKFGIRMVEEPGLSFTKY